ncbi:2,3-diaminopropionate biosynthesis protein SbnA [Micromonospora sp. CNB394]|uniref:2,3-diaminopropionate biosynthesis protein SbnA n=1 Tax=Micromonospora sp. CNB394 TaxID=1169151 RepID=UPI0003747577|nr:2,3-diaminopropionate biosynthesis protein SbnA [Micromonospora sp. CNB394]
MIYDQAHSIVADDVFLRLPDALPGVEVVLKLEGLNPAGSIKLKPAVGMIRDAELRGLLRPGGRVVESSSGSLGIALAMVCAARGYRFQCVTDPNASPQSVAVMRALGAEVVCVDRHDENGGYLQSRIAYIKTLITSDPQVVWLNQYANPANWRVHAETTAAAILAELPKVDFLFVGTGSAGTLMGCVRLFRLASPLTRIVAVDSLGSVSFGRPAGTRFVPGIGASRQPEILRPEAVDDLVVVAEHEAVRTCRWLARERGFFAGGSTGSVVAAMQHYRPAIPLGSQVVGIAPDFGDRYAQTIYEDTWVADRFGLPDISLPTVDLARTRS